MIMKKMMGGLKGFNAKEFFLNHGEKLAFGCGILICLISLGLTSWSRYDKTPQELEKKATDAKSRILATTWPEEKRATFGLKDFAGQAQEVRGPLSITKYEYSTNMWWPLYRKQELAKEAELLAVLDLHAKAGTVTVGVLPKAPAMEGLMADGSGSMSIESAMAGASAGTTPKGKANSEDFDDQFSPVRNRAPTGLGAAGAMGSGGMAAHGEAFAPPPSSAMAVAMDSSMMGGAEMGMGMGMGMSSGLESRGERFIVVRGVWPLWQQMEKMQRALNLQTINDARNFLQLLDFVLERQMAVAGTDPWAGDWEQVDIQRAMDVLNEASGYAFDELDPQIIDPVITMPLPERLVGIWGDYATHPRIENFKLPPAEQERIQKLEEKLVQEYERFQLEEEKKTVRPKGFAGQQRNIRSMATTMFESDYGSTFEQTMRSTMEQDPTMRMQMPDLKHRLTAVGRLLLFRYMDFDVRPGFAYRYRVKLILRNPNFERPLDQVIEPSVAEGPDRETPWSNASNAAVVPESVNYFLEVVDRDPVNEQRPTASRPLAKMDFFEWDPVVGTMIHDTVEVKTYGQFLGEKKESLRLDVAVPSFKDTEVTFRSEDVFLDSAGDVRVEAAVHPDLKLPKDLRGRAGLVPEAVVVDAAGQLAALDPTSNRTKRKSLTDYVARERAPWKDIENQEEKPAMGMLDGAAMPMGSSSSMEQMMGGPAAMMDMQQPRSKSRRKNSRKPGAGSSSMPSDAHGSGAP